MTSKPHHIVYDDGDEEWVNLLHCKFKRVEAKTERLRVSSRVSVYDEEDDQYYPGIITRQRELDLTVSSMMTKAEARNG